MCGGGKGWCRRMTTPRTRRYLAWKLTHSLNSTFPFPLLVSRLSPLAFSSGRIRTSPSATRTSLVASSSPTWPPTRRTADSLIPGTVPPATPRTRLLFSRAAPFAVRLNLNELASPSRQSNCFFIISHEQRKEKKNHLLLVFFLK